MSFDILRKFVVFFEENFFVFFLWVFCRLCWCPISQYPHKLLIKNHTLYDVNKYLFIIHVWKKEISHLCVNFANVRFALSECDLVAAPNIGLISVVSRSSELMWSTDRLMSELFFRSFSVAVLPLFLPPWPVSSYSVIIWEPLRRNLSFKKKFSSFEFISDWRLSSVATSFKSWKEARS